MNLLNHTLRYLAFALFGIISVWAVIFYVNMLDEVYDSLDDGLENYKLLIIDKARQDSVTLNRKAFAEGNYEIREIHEDLAVTRKDVYQDTLMYMMNEQDLEPVRLLTTAFTNKGRYYELKIISSMVEEDDLIEDLFYSIVWLYIALIISILIVNNLLLKKVWKPFYHLLDELKQFRLGKEHTVSPSATSVKEFRVLNETVISLLSHTMEAYSNQKQFIENASHELQTPLAIGISKLELLAEKGDLSETNLETIGQVIRTLGRMTNLNKSLLLLSKIENRQFTETEAVFISRIVKSKAEEFSEFAEYKNVSVTILEKADPVAGMQPDLAEILISNLIKNAIIHNHSNGRVEIEVGDKYFSISNTGNSVALDPLKMFLRFHKGSSERNSSGLGLAIVKGITDLYGFHIGYTYDGMHRVRVSL